MEKTFVLRDYQEKAEKAMLEFLKSNKNKGILVSPVATGKSLYTGLFAKHAKGPTLVIQPTKELLEQNYKKALNYGLKPTIYSSSLGVKEVSDLVYATPMSVVKHADKFKHIENVIIDECLSYDTYVTCVDGRNRKIGEIWKNRHKGLPKVRSLNVKTKELEDDEVTAVERTGKKDIYKLYFDNGRVLECTLNHPILTANGWKQAGDLSEADTVCGSDGNCRMERREFYKNDYCYDIEVKKNHNFIASTTSTDEGIVVHNCHLNTTRVKRGGKISRLSTTEEFLNAIRPKKVLGITATPVKLHNTLNGAELRMINRDSLSYFFKAPIIHITQISEIKDKYWCDYDIEVKPNYDKKRLRYNTAGSEFTMKSMLETFEINGGIKNIDETIDYLLHFKHKANILIFMPSLNHAKQLSAMRDDCELISGELPDKQREKVLKDFEMGKTRVLLNYGVLTTGYDFPDLESIIIARETASFQLYYQIMGRVVRPFMASKTDKAIVFDLTANTERFGDIKDIIFDQQEVVNGWCLRVQDKIITGFSIMDKGAYPTIAEIQEVRDARKRKLSGLSGEYAEKDITLTFGKHKGKTVRQIAKGSPGYIKWMMASFDFDMMGPYGESLKEHIKYVTIENGIYKNKRFKKGG